MATTGGRRVPRPLAHTLHADTPNQLIHFDFLYMGASKTAELYVLIIKDDASAYVRLYTSEAADAETAVYGLRD